MSSFSPLGFSVNRRVLTAVGDGEHEHFVVRQQPLRRVLAFTRLSIDDVVNCPIAKRQVLGYYKLHKWVERGCEITDMNRWWNGEAAKPRRWQTLTKAKTA